MNHFHIEFILIVLGVRHSQTLDALGVMIFNSYFLNSIIINNKRYFYANHLFHYFFFL
jgi:hypothetical protein